MNFTLSTLAVVPLVAGRYIALNNTHVAPRPGQASVAAHSEKNCCHGHNDRNNALQTSE
jgi:hypothetical protein